MRNVHVEMLSEHGQHKLHHKTLCGAQRRVHRLARLANDAEHLGPRADQTPVVQRIEVVGLCEVHRCIHTRMRLVPLPKQVHRRRQAVCDARVQRVDVVEDTADLTELARRGAPGGGGTDFCPVFDAISEMDDQPECLVYLTDGYGRFPAEAPDYPVIWGTVGLAPDKYPFGEAVTVSV